MNDHPQNLRPELSQAELHALLVRLAIERLSALGGPERRNRCMMLPDSVFQPLCRRLLERRNTVRSAADWLATRVKHAPGRSSVARFSDALYDEFRALTRDRVRRGER